MKTYEEFYNICRKNYIDQGENPDQKINLYNLGMEIITPDSDSDLIELPKNYLKTIQKLSDKVNQKVDNISEHYNDPSAQGEPLAIQIKNIWDIPELEQIADSILPHLERNVFASYIHLSAIHIYRNIKFDGQPLSSWLWHYDNNPKEAVKMLVYLTDVGEDNAPFEYMVRDGEAKKMETSRTGFNHWKPPYIPNSRISAQMISDLEKEGYKKKKITGPAGTILFFDNNIIHRATSPKDGYRDVAIFNIRPAEFKIRPWVSEDTTGSWTHKSPIVDPSLLKPRLK